MRKILFVIIALLLAFSSKAQEALPHNAEVEMQALVHRVDSLEHEISYLKLKYELYTLLNDLKVLKNEMTTNSYSVQLNFFSKNYSYQLGDVYKKQYESYEQNIKATKDLIEAKKRLCMLSIIANSYPEDDSNILKNYCEYIDKVYDSLEYTLKLYKTSVDVYIDTMN